MTGGEGRDFGAGKEGKKTSTYSNGGAIVHTSLTWCRLLWVRSWVMMIVQRRLCSTSWRSNNDAGRIASSSSSSSSSHHLRRLSTPTIRALRYVNCTKLITVVRYIRSTFCPVFLWLNHYRFTTEYTVFTAKIVRDFHLLSHTCPRVHVDILPVAV